jgi:hypothetical protein
LCPRLHVATSREKSIYIIISFFVVINISNISFLSDGNLDVSSVLGSKLNFFYLKFLESVFVQLQEKQNGKFVYPKKYERQKNKTVHSFNAIIND